MSTKPLPFYLTAYMHSLLWISFSALFAFLIAFAFYERYKKKWKLNTLTLTSIYWGLVIAVLMLDTIAFTLTANQQAAAVLAAIGGASIGWLLGMWLSPLGKNESSKFTSYWTAIGVGSGFSIKWLVDHVAAHVPWIKEHWVVTAIGTITCLVTAATVYNSRAYDDSLTIYPRREPGGAAPSTSTPFAIIATKSQVFYAEVVGASDAMCKWDVLPATLGTIDATGSFTAGLTKGVGKIVAFNLEDPTLSNCLEIEVVEAATP